jgi:hypothetical protein
MDAPKVGFCFGLAVKCVEVFAEKHARPKVRVQNFVRIDHLRFAVGEVQ